MPAPASSIPLFCYHPLIMQRRSFLATPLAAFQVAAAAEPSDTRVDATGDGVHHTPKEYSRLLARLTEADTVAPDSYSLGGVVQKLEARMASLLGKETAVWLPTGTLANHLAVRLLAGNRRRVLVQAESHLYNDCGDCAQTLSGLTLIPLARGKAEFHAGGRRGRSLRRADRPGDHAHRRHSDRNPGATAAGRALRLRADEDASPPGRARTTSDCTWTAPACSSNPPTPAGRSRSTPRCSIPSTFRSTSISTPPAARFWPVRKRCSQISFTRAACSAAACRMCGPTPRLRCTTWRDSSSVSERAWRPPRPSSRRWRQNSNFGVERIPNGTNIFRLRVFNVNAPVYKMRLFDAGVTAADPAGEWFSMQVNETWGRAPAAEITRRLTQALG